MLAAKGRKIQPVQVNQGQKTDKGKAAYSSLKYDCPKKYGPHIYSPGNRIHRESVCITFANG